MGDGIWDPRSPLWPDRLMVAQYTGDVPDIHDISSKNGIAGAEKLAALSKSAMSHDTS